MAKDRQTGIRLEPGRVLKAWALDHGASGAALWRLDRPLSRQAYLYAVWLPPRFRPISVDHVRPRKSLGLAAVFGSEIRRYTLPSQEPDSPTTVVEILGGEEVSELSLVMLASSLGLQRAAVAQRISDAIDSALVDIWDETVAGLPPQANRMHRMASELASLLNVVEVTLFMAPRPNAASAEVVATTWPKDLPKKGYAFDDERGTTSWAIRKRAPIFIEDVRELSSNGSAIYKRYPGLVWRGTDSYERATKVWRSASQILASPPLSVILIPVCSRTLGTVGVLRISMPLPESVVTFREQDLALFGSVAERLAVGWHAWLSDRERRAWQAVFAKIDRRMIEALRNLPTDTERWRDFVKGCLKDLHESVPGCDLLDVRLLDEEASQLYFFVTEGDGWDSESNKGAANRRFDYDESANPRSAGEYVMQTGHPYHMFFGNARGARGVPMYHGEEAASQYYDPTFEETTELICIRVSSNGKAIGVLDMRSLGGGGMAPFAVSVAELVAAHLGLVRTIAGLYAHLAAVVKSQQDAYEDVAHQLVSPLIPAYKRTQRILRFGADERDIYFRLAQVRGLLRKCHVVAQHAEVFGKIARQEEFSFEAPPTPGNYLAKLLSEAANDVPLTGPSHRNIAVVFNRQRFEKMFGGLHVFVNEDVFLQVLYVLLDNACKYSDSNSTVLVDGSVSNEGKALRLRVANVGIPLSEADAQRALSRGWRSAPAREVTSEGDGLGLWIASQLMKRHPGSLFRLHPSVIRKDTGNSGITVAEFGFACSGEVASA